MEEPTDQSPSETLGETGFKRGSHPRSLANLAPAWRPGQSGNASGLTKDGRPTKSAPVSKALLERLEGKPTVRMVDRWVKDAIDHKDGHVRAKARAQILERLYPVVDDPTLGKVILEGLKLELSPGKASLTVCSAQNTASLETWTSALPATQPRDVEASVTASHVTAPPPDATELPPQR